MSLAQRVRDSRYARGWGPDELASRAAISRTALYQIESGRTEQPRAGTLRRIASALNLPTESLLEQATESSMARAYTGQALEISLDDVRQASTLGRDPDESIVLTPTSHPTLAQSTAWTLSDRERDIERKFVELLRSPMGEGLARIVEETYRLLPKRSDSIR